MPLAAGGLGGARAPVLLAHLAVLTAVVWAELRRAAGRAGPATRLFADLHLLVLIPALYAELPLLMEGLASPVAYHDPAVQAVEAALFGLQPAWALAGAAPLRWLSELLHLAYLLYYPIIYLPPLLLYARAMRGSGGGDGAGGAGHGHGGEDGGATTWAAFDHAMAALALSVTLCYLVFVLWPVQGPRYLGAPEAVPAGPLRALTLAVLEGGSSRGAAFPSSHVAVAVALTLVTLRRVPRLGGALLVVTPLLALGAVYGGFHYAVDALAGAAVGAAAAALGGWLARPARPERGPGAADIVGGCDACAAGGATASGPFPTAREP